MNNIDWYKTNRQEQYNYVEKIVKPGKDKEGKYHENISFKVISAPVKSGKKDLVIIYKLLDPEKIHIFISALHRKADQVQRDEYKNYEIDVYSLNSIKKVHDCVNYIKSKLGNNNKIIVHLDELDYGCGKKQNMSSVIKEFENDENLNFILYSATPEVAQKEFLGSSYKYVMLEKFTPPETYFGIKRYLDKNLVNDAYEFFKYDGNNIKLSEQGELLIDKLKESDKTIGILRLTGNIKKDKTRYNVFKDNKEYIQNTYGIELRFVSSDDDCIEWGNKNYWKANFNHTLKHIIVINQVAGRSTQWRCHPYLVWYHCMRQEKTPASTITQDQERVVYYEEKGYENVNIEIYGDKSVAEYSAGIITYNEYSERDLSSRLTSNKKTKIAITREPKYYDTWEEIPMKYRKNRKKSRHVNEEFKIKKQMKIKDKEYTIDIEQNSKIEGFYLPNIRSSRDQFIKSGGKTNPKLYKSDILRDEKEGLNNKSKVRINLYYNDDEIDPQNYKFIIRELKEMKNTDYKNNSVYNN